MSVLRKQMLDAERIEKCHACYTMERNGKVSGRQKALLKTGIDQQRFDEDFRFSSFFDEYHKSYNNNGDTDLMPVDWQIDLGNYCNSACIMCSPISSSRLAQEWYELGFTKNKPVNENWVDDPELFDSFVNSLVKIKNLRYLHFIGGETVITPAFVKILDRLVQHGLSDNIILGFTTNLTVYDEKTIAMLKQFKDVHVGLSIETMNTINDYIRWPSKIDKVKVILDKWVETGKKQEWNISIRPAPNVLSIMYIDQLYDYVMKNKVGIETCNFLYKPKYLKINALPMDLRKKAIERIKKVIDVNHSNEQKIFNIRNPNTYDTYVRQDATSFINYLQHEPYDTTYHKELVDFLQRLEQKRNNSILDHLPEYEEFFRSIGYQH